MFVQKRTICLYFITNQEFSNKNDLSHLFLILSKKKRLTTNVTINLNFPLCKPTSNKKQPTSKLIFF